MTIAGILSLILDISFGDNPSIDWIEGTSILVAVLVVTVVTAINDYEKEKQFQALNAIQEEEKVSVIRDGKIKEMSIHKILVGDVLLIEVRILRIQSFPISLS